MSRLEGAAALKRQLLKIDPSLRPEIAKAIEKNGRLMQAMMKANIPRSDKAPHLQDYIGFRMSRNQLSGRVGLLTKRQQKIFRYWYWLEYGTVKMRARPFARSAIERARKTYAADARQALDTVLRRVAQSG